MPQIRIGDDGTIISSDGDVAQGENPIIGADGTINIGQEPSVIVPHRTTAPASPLEEGAVRSDGELIPAPSQRQIQTSRPVQSIEYDLSIKRAEAASSVHLGPIVGMVAIIMFAVATGLSMLAWAAILPGISVVRDLAHRSEASAEVQRLEDELESARRNGGPR